LSELLLIDWPSESPKLNVIEKLNWKQMDGMVEKCRSAFKNGLKGVEVMLIINAIFIS
jgi:hypothetical protein